MFGVLIQYMLKENLVFILVLGMEFDADKGILTDCAP